MRQDRFLIAILSGIALLIVVALAVFFSRRTSIEYGNEDSPAGIVQNYLVALQKQDYQRAYEYLSNETYKPDSFRFQQDMIMRRGEIGRTSLEIGEATTSGAQAMVQLTILRVQSGIFGDTFRNTEAARLVQENGKWKIISFPYPFWSYDWYQIPPEKIVPPGR
jgi:hypothetical protein